MPDELKPHRTLTDEDVEAIVAMLRERVVREFYQDIGRGIWAVIWKLSIAVALVLAAYGSVKTAHVSAPVHL